MAALPTPALDESPKAQQRYRRLPFQPRVQLIGSLYWLCPACGRCNRARIAPATGYRVKCKHRGCGAAFRIGFTLWQQDRGDSRIPLDEPFPRAETAQLGRGRYIHAAVPCDEPGEPADSSSSKPVLP